jgi:hypothetical protein
MKYFSRTSALVYLLVWSVKATTQIGETPDLEPLTWQDAWTFALVLFTAMLLGWLAHKEAEKD